MIEADAVLQRLRNLHVGRETDDARRRLGVWANADYPRDAKVARTYGAEGIGLCRTEHMFMEQERLPIVQKMILAADEKERRQWLAKLLPLLIFVVVGLFFLDAHKLAIASPPTATNTRANVPNASANRRRGQTGGSSAVSSIT